MKVDLGQRDTVPSRARHRASPISGPCALGCETTSALKNGIARWYRLPKGTPWPGVQVGAVLCKACYDAARRSRTIHGQGSSERPPGNASPIKKKSRVSPDDDFLHSSSSDPRAQPEDGSTSSGYHTIEVSNPSRPRVAPDDGRARKKPRVAPEDGYCRPRVAPCDGLQTRTIKCKGSPRAVTVKRRRRSER